MIFFMPGFFGGSGGGYVPTCRHCGKAYPQGKDKSRFAHFRDRHDIFDMFFTFAEVFVGLAILVWISLTLMYWAVEAPEDARAAIKYPSIYPNARITPPTIPEVLKQQGLWIKETARRVW